MIKKNYSEIINKRQEYYQNLKKDPNLLLGAKKYYKDNPVGFINDWCMTYDPRNTAYKIPVKMPFKLFPRQKELVNFIMECFRDQESGLIEKTRDMGATWVCVCLSVWFWLFVPGSSIGWGSRKEVLVDKLGDPDSIFEKIRMTIRDTPLFFLPPGFDPKKHTSYMRVINPENGSTITGEAGNNIGRGGRKTAQPLDSLVLTPFGYKKIKDINIGDQVIGYNGKITNVIDTVYYNEADIYKIKFQDGVYTECSNEHLWQLTTRKIRKSIRRKPENPRTPRFIIENIDRIKNDYLYKRPDGQIETEYHIPIVSQIEFKPRKLPINPYIVGCLLGDGSLHNLDKSSPMIHNEDRFIINKIISKLPAGIKLKKVDKLSYRIIDTELKKGRGKKSKFKTLLKKTGIYGMKSDKKNIPDKYKYTSIKNRIDILHGLIDTDGWITTNKRTSSKICFCSTSKKLADDMRFLVESLGGIATIRFKKKQKKIHSQAYEMVITLPDNVRPCSLPIKLKGFKHRKKYTIHRKITNIEYIGKKPAKCISVKNSDGLYLTNNCIVTHNCYFTDEAAHLEQPELIEASLSHNTNVRIDISSVNGTANIFARKRKAGVIWTPDKKIKPGITRVFILDWRDHPNKSQEWYNKKRDKAEREGLLHIFAQEVDRDYLASIDRVVIPNKFVTAAIDAHKVLKFKAEGKKITALDVADEGGDKNAVTFRHGNVCVENLAWAEGDTSETTRKTITLMKKSSYYELQYDSIGVGSGIKASINILKKSDKYISKIVLVKWNAGAKVIFPEKRIIAKDKETPKNKDFFSNLKAQAWWNARTRFEKTYNAITKGVKYDQDELISIDSKIGNVHELIEELSQPTFTTNNAGKIVINKKPTGINSPNKADSFVMCFWPLKSKKVII